MSLNILDNDESELPAERTADILQSLLPSTEYEVRRDGSEATRTSTPMAVTDMSQATLPLMEQEGARPIYDEIKVLPGPPASAVVESNEHESIQEQSPPSKSPRLALVGLVVQNGHGGRIHVVWHWEQL